MVMTIMVFGKINKEIKLFFQMVPYMKTFPYLCR